jgi:hypothetical protein
VAKYVSPYFIAGVSVVALSITLVCFPPEGTPAFARADDAAQEKLEAVRKRLPGAINQGFKKVAGIGVKESDVKIELFRRLSPTEAKVTVVLAEESVLTFYLRYYDGAWTTIRHEARCDGIMKGREEALIDMALAIDEIGNAK